MIIAILAGMLLPALKAAQRKAHAIYCTNTLKQLGVGCLQYTSDNNDWIMPATMPTIYSTASWTDSDYWTYHSSMPDPVINKLYLNPYLPKPPPLKTKPIGTRLSKYCCPGIEPNTSHAYCMNGKFEARSGKNFIQTAMQKITRVKQPTKLLHITEGYTWFFIYSGRVLIGAKDKASSDYLRTAMAFRHSGSSNTLYADGHVSPLSISGYKYTDEMWLFDL